MPHMQNLTISDHLFDANEYFSTTKLCWLRDHIFTSVAIWIFKDFEVCTMDNSGMKNEYFPKKNFNLERVFWHVSWTDIHV